MAGDGGADGSILGDCGGVLPVVKLLVLLVDPFLLGLLHRRISNVTNDSTSKTPRYRSCGQRRTGSRDDLYHLHLESIRGQ